MSAALALLSPGEAQRLTQRIRLTASSVRDELFKLRNLVDEARGSNVWQVLGFPSWTAYLADTLGAEPMRLGREERQELVSYLAGEGLSTRAIAPIVGAHFTTVADDIEKARVGIPTPEPEVVESEDWTPGVAVNAVTGEVTEPGDPLPVVTEHTVTEKVRTVTGLDGKEYKTPDPRNPKRRPLVDAARDAGWDLRKAAERLQRIQDDDRFSRNKAEILAALKPHLDFATEVINGL